MSLAGAFALAWGLLMAATPSAARENLRLPWVFSDAPDLSADFGFEPGLKGRTRVTLDLGGRFAGFGLPSGAGKAPRLDISAEITAPTQLQRDVSTLQTRVDLNEVLSEYGLSFARQHFRRASTLVYKASLDTELQPGDYNVRLLIADPVLGVESRRTLHLIVPRLDPGQWQLGDLRFITAVGQRLDERGRQERWLDPNPWRQVGGTLGWDLQVAYSDLGARPGGALKRKITIRRLRGKAEPLWSEESAPPAKGREQVWLLHVPEAELKAWKPGVHLLEVELSAGGRTVRAAKSFEVIP